MNHPGASLNHWLRQWHRAVKTMEGEKLYQISQVPKAHPNMRPEVIATCSKRSAQRLLAALALEDTGYRFGITATFIHPLFPMRGMER